MKKSFLLFCFLLNGLLAQDSLVFVIRVDDIYSRSTSYLPQGITPFQNAVEQKGGKVTWAVMPHRLIEPMNLSGNLSAELRASIVAGHEIAQHGYIHICTRCNSSGHEMYCASTSFNFPYSYQMDLIKQGMQILKDSLDTVPITFVPPGHYADTVTYQVLLDSNFQFLSTTGFRQQYIYKDLYNLSPHSEFTWQLTPEQYRSKMTNALYEIRTNGLSNGYYCLLLHDPFIRPSYQNSLVINWTSELFDSLNFEFGSRIKYLTLSQAAASFRGPLTGTPHTESEIPASFELLQSYPNPFNPATTIQFNVHHQEFVSLKIYDIKGSEVAELLNQEMDAGLHEVTFSSEDLKSGVYFCRIQKGNFFSTLKILFMK